MNILSDHWTTGATVFRDQEIQLPADIIEEASNHGCAAVEFKSANMS